MLRNFSEMLKAKWAEGKFVCVGLDPDFKKIPECVRKQAKENALPGRMGERGAVVSFCLKIVEATKDLVCAFKPNSAFFEGLSVHEGVGALHEVIGRTHEMAPDVPIILDAKRADIGNTNAGYVKSAFGMLGADAITVHPYLGREALQPFLDCKDNGVIILCRTSNSGAGEFQDLRVTIERDELAWIQTAQAHGWSNGTEGDRTTLSNHVAYQISKKWNTNGNCAIVVGATYPEELESIRRIVGDLPILIPGIGAQGGDLEATVAAGKDSHNSGMIINSSRGIIFASSGEDFAEAARRETLKLHEAIQQRLK
jgi:orotidine-5'-phosphate decarboxylase